MSFELLDHSLLGRREMDVLTAIVCGPDFPETVDRLSSLHRFLAVMIAHFGEEGGEEGVRLLAIRPAKQGEEDLRAFLKARSVAPGSLPVVEDPRLPVYFKLPRKSNPNMSRKRKPAP